ncbi:type IV pili methyl-accepting chemotaxis transducer N-terminal domain-containing protein [Noviherbaspirillum denitrificans]|uniref:histidine kinase n=1 Tax=Noviherbaspirillum denitrificans TaxID=1968433 RepID=A0A254TRR7_9BURK|nr:type IV pili methyl-accepting chemotaxis transducer N-terminal domain-containing protein [Noviherbaspirillum denitrificans]OWW22418.1 hypothetical protein AYR66_25900 [Noviherbaspirillum denitrificans]
MQAESSSRFAGKYREIILAVACFLVFDLAVLVLNFYISFQISEDALSINLAGRQRMLSQRMAKALLVIETDVERGATGAQARTELGRTVELFDTTLKAFQSGGTATGGDDKPVRLARVDSPEGRNVLAQANELWLPYRQKLVPLLAPGAFTPLQLAEASEKARDTNLKLLALMNALTSQLEQTANAKADTLRMVQTGGILLALMNFAFILFKFIRRLRDNDRKIEAAQKETADILGTVTEGLFLLDSTMHIGSQYSASLQRILGRPVAPGTDFRNLLGDLVKESTFDLAIDYIELLFGDRVKESLIGDLNPLTAVEFTFTNPEGMPVRRVLSMQFNRVRDNGKVSHLLVTVFDITAQVELENALADAKEKAKAEIEIMLDLLKVNPATLEQFLKNAEAALLDINAHLRAASSENNHRRMVGTIFRKIHALKGEAAVLELHLFENLAQQFESQLAELRDKGMVSGDDLLSLPFPVEEFLQKISMVRDLIARLSDYHSAFNVAADDGFASNLATLAERIAADHGKQVKIETDLDLMRSLPQRTRVELQDIAVQLLRNAVAHGIETAGERHERAKPAAGSIYIGLKPTESGEYALTLRDDGRGLSPQHIRDALLKSGRYNEAQLAELDDRQIVMKIFEAGVSTATQVTRDSGHGVGMDVVKNKVAQLGARIRISSRVDAFTQFSIHFAA